MAHAFDCTCCSRLFALLLVSCRWLTHAQIVDEGRLATAIAADGITFARAQLHHRGNHTGNSIADLGGSNSKVVRKESTQRRGHQERSMANDFFQSSLGAAEDADATIVQWTRVDDINAKSAEFRKCRRGTCMFTANRAELMDAAAVSWYLPSMSLEDMPTNRPKGQLWAVEMDETPCAYDMARSESLLSLFNIAVSMSENAHVRKCPYVNKNVLEHLDNPAMATKMKDDFRRNGTGLVAYIQSHCIDHRNNLVAALEAEGVQVDSFGKCHHNKDFPKGLEGLQAWTEFDKQEFYNFEKRYKFAISLENCRCRDYVTEKLFRRLHLGVVPIYEPVGQDVRSWLPSSNSIINISAFQSARELALELKRLDANASAYEELLAWKRQGVHDTPLGHALDECVQSGDQCAICDEVLKQRSQGASLSIAASPPFGVCPIEKRTDIESKVIAFRKHASHLEFVPQVPGSASFVHMSCLVSIWVTLSAAMAT